jgi:hypothetical protein
MVYSNQQPQTLPLPNPQPLRTQAIYEEQVNMEGQELSQDTTDIISTLRVVAWDHNIPDILLHSDQDPFNPAQVFQGSFDNIESAGTVELLFANHAMWEAGESWDSQFAGAAAG